MAALTITPITRSGTAAAAVAAAVGGDTMANGGQEFLKIINASAGSITVSATITKQVDSVTPAAKQITVAAGATKYFGPFAVADYNDANGNVAFTYSAVTDVTVQALQLVKA